jgi:hypothetical protein
MKFLVHEGKDTTGAMCWYESGIDVVAGNTIAVPGPSRKTFTVDSKVVGETMEENRAEPIKQVWLFCTLSNVSADAPEVIQLTVADPSECVLVGHKKRPRSEAGADH